MKILNATPEKRVFLSIISEYDLRTALCELIDNAIDLRTKKKLRNLVVNISLDDRQQTISIEDNAGGLEEAKLDYIISPGKTSNDIQDEGIGYFGVGSKRAVVALAKDISIYSRFENDKTFLVKLDENWITYEPSWDLPYAESPRILSPNTTIIDLSRLRRPITKEGIDEIREHLSEVYARFSARGDTIMVNNVPLKAVHFDKQWSYPPGYHPTKFHTTLPIEARKVDIEILCGLINYPGDRDKSYGVFIYCNNRLIARALTDFSVGFTSGMVGIPHYNISLVRTIVSIRGQSQDMPWNSSKSGINSNHHVYQAIRQSIVDATKSFAQVSRSLQGKWDTDVFPYKKGKIIEKELETISAIPKTYLPTHPPSKQSWQEKLKSANAAIIEQKRWAAGLLDSCIAVDMIFNKQSLNQKNRVCLILLDSTLEIAYKEFLVHEKNIGKAKFSGIVANRTDVENEVMKYITVDVPTMQKIHYYYQMRNDLIHVRATPSVSDPDILDYRSIVEELLLKMFGLNFK